MASQQKCSESKHFQWSIFNAICLCLLYKADKKKFCLLTSTMGGFHYDEFAKALSQAGYKCQALLFSSSFSFGILAKAIVSDGSARAAWLDVR